MASTAIPEFSTDISNRSLSPDLSDVTSGPENVRRNTTAMEGAGTVIVWTVVVFLSVVGVVLNVALLFTVASLTRKRHKASRVVLGNLCIVDLLVCVVYFPLLAVSLDSCSQLCSLMVPIERGLVGSLTWSTAFISLDRYIFIVKHAAYRAKMTPKRTAVGLVSTWTVGCIFAVVSFALSDHQDEPTSGHCLCLVARHYYGFYSLLYSACFIVFCFILPSIFTVVFYGFVIRAAYKHVAPKRRKARQRSYTDGTLQEAPATLMSDTHSVTGSFTIVVPQVNLYQIKTAKILFVILGLYFTLVVPYFVVNLTLSDGSHVESQDVDLYFVYATCSLLLFATSASNPICYGFCSRLYRDSIMRFARRWRRRTVDTEFARWRGSTISGLSVIADGSSGVLSRSRGSTASSHSEVSAISQGGLISRDFVSNCLDAGNVRVTSSSRSTLSVPLMRPPMDVLCCDTSPVACDKFRPSQENSDPTDLIRKPLGSSLAPPSKDTAGGSPRTHAMESIKSADCSASIQRPTGDSATAWVTPVQKISQKTDI